ncbi:MAG: c-type cytochrome [Rhodospirillaceae bacterium]
MSVRPLLIALLWISPALAEGDAERGWFIASGGIPRAGACFPCHGLAGEGDDAQAAPRLAGLSAWYLYKQMKNYTDGTRDNSIMSPIAKEMQVQDWWDIAAFYAGLNTPLPPAPPPDDNGRTIAEEKCASCHGDEGKGAPFAVPALAGQGAAYMRNQLTAWVAGRRRNDPAGAMQTITRDLSPQEAAAVSAYYEALRAD